MSLDPLEIERITKPGFRGFIDDLHGIAVIDGKRIEFEPFYRQEKPNRWNGVQEKQNVRMG